MDGHGSEHEHHHHHAHGGMSAGECGACTDCVVCAAGTECGTGEITVSSRMHEEALVVSASLKLSGDYAVVRRALELQLAAVAQSVANGGGIVGHIKASCEITETEVFSVTESDVTINVVDEQWIHITAVAIVFGVNVENAEKYIRAALETVKSIVEQ